MLLSSDDIRGDLAELYGYVNRSLPDAELDAFVEALATRIGSFEKWAISNTKRLVNASLPLDVVLPEPCKPTIRMELGLPLRARPALAEPSNLTISS